MSRHRERCGWRFLMLVVALCLSFSMLPVSNAQAANRTTTDFFTTSSETDHDSPKMMSLKTELADQWTPTKKPLEEWNVAEINRYMTAAVDMLKVWIVEENNPDPIVIRGENPEIEITEGHLYKVILTPGGVIKQMGWIVNNVALSDMDAMKNLKIDVYNNTAMFVGAKNGKFQIGIDVRNPVWGRVNPTGNKHVVLNPEVIKKATPEYKLWLEASRKERATKQVSRRSIWSVADKENSTTPSRPNESGNSGNTQPSGKDPVNSGGQTPGITDPGTKPGGDNPGTNPGKPDDKNPGTKPGGDNPGGTTDPEKPGGDKPGTTDPEKPSVSGGDLPCEHDWGDGSDTCVKCGEKHDHDTKGTDGSCSICGKACEHVWNDTTCTKCGTTHEHDTKGADGGCSICGTPCAHVWDDTTCIKCGTIHEHDTDGNNGSCSICGTPCDHAWNDTVCTKCGTTHEHNALGDNGNCTICGKACEHVWNGTTCTKCGVTHEHDTKGNNGSCSICGTPCAHVWDDTKCTKCGMTHEHDTEGTDGSCSVCGKGGMGEVDPPELQEIDQTNWKVDQTTFPYDSLEHRPTLLNVQDTVKVTYSHNGYADANKYSVTVTFEVPEGYKPIPDMVIEYTIEPSVVTLEQIYDPETKQVKTLVTGVADGDVAGIESTVNNVVADNVTLNKVGHYDVETTLTIDPDKTQNYVIDDSGIKDRVIYDVKSNKPWFNISMNQEITEDGLLLITFVMEDLKIPQVGTNQMTTLEFDVQYDRSKLEYVDYDQNGAYSWDCFMVSNSGADATKDLHPMTAYWGWTAPMSSGGKICQLKFNIAEGATDVPVTINNALVTSNTSSNGSLPYNYKGGGSTTIIVNPTENAPEVKEMTVEHIPTLDAEYRTGDTNWGGREKEAEAALKEHLNQVMPGWDKIDLGEEDIDDLDDLDAQAETAGTQSEVQAQATPVAVEISAPAEVSQVETTETQAISAETEVTEAQADAAGTEVSNTEAVTGVVTEEVQTEVAVETIEANQEGEQAVVEATEASLEGEQAVIETEAKSEATEAAAEVSLADAA